METQFPRAMMWNSCSTRRKWAGPYPVSRSARPAISDWWTLPRARSSNPLALAPPSRNCSPRTWSVLIQVWNAEPFGDSKFHWPVDSKSLFHLSAADGEWHRDDMLPPGCTTANTQDDDHYYSCLFTIERGGFELSFWLNGVNVAYADDFADYVLTKLASWKVED